MVQARINIIEPNGVRRSMPLGLQGLVIGRDPGCEIPLAYERISRQHAEIAFDGQECYVTDLDSRNGTFIGKNRLTPNTPTPWAPDQALRVGDVYFNLEIPRSQQVRQKAAQQEETLAGYIPAHPIKPKDNRRILWFTAGGLALLCVCAGVAALIFSLM